MVGVGSARWLYGPLMECLVLCGLYILLLRCLSWPRQLVHPALLAISASFLALWRKSKPSWAHRREEAQWEPSQAHLIGDLPSHFSTAFTPTELSPQTLNPSDFTQGSKPGPLSFWIPQNSLGFLSFPSIWGLFWDLYVGLGFEAPF